MKTRSTQLNRPASRPAIDRLESRTLMSQTFVIDAAESYASLSVSLTTSNKGQITATPQHPGSLTTHTAGKITLDATPTSVNLTNLSFALANNGNAQPGNSSASLAGIMTGINPKTGKPASLDFALRNMMIHVTSGLMKLSSGKFTGHAGAFTASGTIVGYDGTKIIQHVGTFTNKLRLTTTITGSLTEEPDGHETLKLDIVTTATGAKKTTAKITFSEQIVATG